MRKVVIFLMSILLAGAVCMAAPKWESVNAPGREVTMTQHATNESGVADNIDVGVSDGYIYVASSRPVTVKVFTILGQLISQETLPAGTHRLRMSSKGIYILKAADVTRRVTI